MVVARTVYAGTCKQNDKLVCGVVEKQDFCDDGSWQPPHVVADSGHPNRICAYYPDTMVIGRCGSDGPCSNLASRCTDPDSFILRDPNCRITKDYGDESSSKFGGKYTTYGKCGDRCVWSPGDCLDGEEYINDDIDCTADKVKLGACLDGFGYCTVSRKTCTNVDGITVEPYYTHDEFKTKFDTNCYLADLPETPAPAVPTPPSTIASVPAPTVPRTNNFAPPSATSKLSQNVIIGIVIGITLPVGIALGILAARYRSNKTQPVAVTEKSLPPMTIAVSSREVGVDDVSEDLSIGL
jgi:hypothetical protein